MNIIGIDVHKRKSYYTIMDDMGNKIKEDKFLTTREELDEFIESLPDDVTMTVEASTSGLFVYEHLKDKGMDVHLAHPALVKPFARQHVKTDKIDATTLANLLRMGYLPEAHLPPGDLRDVRILVRQRVSLVRMRVRFKNKIHALLAQEGIRHGFSDLFGKAGLVFLKNANLRESRQKVLNQCLEIIDFVDQKIDEMNLYLDTKVKNLPQIKWATSVHGIGKYSAFVILGEAGDVTRFSTPKSLTCYAGLVPRVHNSGNRTYHGHVNRNCNKLLRSTLIQCARVAVRKPNRFQRIYNKVKARRGDKKAIVAAARELLTSIYWVLIKEEPYQESSSRTAFRAPIFSGSL